jgi:hypothetical protein
MRARRVDQGSDFRLLQNEREIGSLNSDVVRFHGFVTQRDAAAAAAVAQRSVARRRKAAAPPARDPNEVLILNNESTEFVVARSGILARLLPPSFENAESGWGFEVELWPDEAFEVFAVSRARLMWRALQRSPLKQRMLQFRT